MGRKLHQIGLPVSIYTDAALMSNIDMADAVWIGGDAIYSKGLVNKTGSRALAILAQFKGIPFISLTSSYKVLADDMMPYFKLLSQNPREISAEDADELNIVNEYYETIPLSLISHVFTEIGLQKPVDLLDKVKPERISKLFIELVES
jgi:translation initiation factor 2B subunit (eIF-2B alpha/beta/delta family)